MSQKLISLLNLYLFNIPFDAENNFKNFGTNIEHCGIICALLIAKELFLVHFGDLFKWILFQVIVENIS